MTIEEALKILKCAIDGISEQFSDSNGSTNGKQWKEKVYEALTTVTSTLQDAVSIQTVDELKSDIMGWINSECRGRADYFIVDKIEELVKGFNPSSFPPKEE